MGHAERTAPAGTAEIALLALNIAPAARRDIAQMRAWFTQPGAGAVAQRRTDHILAAIRSLPVHPERHPADRRGRREFSVEGYRVRYRVRPHEVLLLRVFGPGQDRG